MHCSSIRWGNAGRFIPVLLLMFVASGCREMKPGKKTVLLTCGDQTVDVNTTDGAKPQAVYVCEGDTVTWNSNGHTFLVEFTKDSPFEDNGKKFDNGNPKSRKTKYLAQLTVFEYRITVDTTHVFDPQVIGGGA